MKILLSLFFVISIASLYAQPVIDGNVNDASYTTIATYTSGRNGGGSNVALGSIKYTQDGNYLYIGVAGEPRQGFGGMALLLDFSGVTGRGSNTLCGSSYGPAGFGGGLRNLIMDSGFDADFAFDIVKTWSSTDSYMNVVRFQSGDAGIAVSGGIGGNIGQAGTAIDANCSAGTGGTGNIRIAFRSGFAAGGNQYGLEMRIPLSTLPGVTADQTVKMFVIVNGDYDSTPPFDECMPGDPGAGPLSTSFDYSSVAGQQFYTNVVSALPVELNSFSVILDKDAVVLNWKTETELNNYGFDIERNTSNSKWEKIGFVAGHGNSNSPNEYSFTDENPSAGKSLYRLKQLDSDGKSKYYDAVSVSVDAPKTFKLMQNSPNPFNPSTAIKFQLPVNAMVNVKVYDMMGREVTALVNEEKPAGSHIVYWNGRDNSGQMISSGVYLYRISAGSYSETRKMNLLK